MYSIQTIAATGHRPAGLPAGAERHIRAGVREIVGQHPGATWLVGGAIGADQIATDELLKLGERVELVLPFRPDIQAARWTRDQQRVLREQVARAAAVHVIRGHYDPAAYHERNRHMVQRADLLVAFWNGRERGGGTVSTIRLAGRLRVPVIWFQMA